MCRKCLQILIPVALVLLLGGCFDRKERIVISPRGSVSFELSYRTDSMEDLLEGDAMPTPQAGWATEQKAEKDAEGKVSYSITALAAFPPKFALPSNFATRSDADADLYLQFPTTLKVEKRRDGTYYHFRRVYTTRPMVEFDRLKQKLVEDPLKGIGAEPREWTEEHRILIVQSLARFEVEKMLIFGRAACLHATPEAPQDGWLAVCGDLRSFIEQLDYTTLAKLIVPKEEEPKADDAAEKTIDSESRRLQAELIERLRTDLRDLAGLDGSQVNAFMREFNRRKMHFDITEDLGDEMFEINVDMPGTIIANNADEVNARTAVWKFDGNRMHDVDFELMVTSRVEN